MIGGNNEDVCLKIRIDKDGYIYITGSTRSTNFPTTPGAYDTIKTDSSYDIYVAKLNPSGSSLIFSTFLKGNGTDWGEAIAVDKDANVYITGTTDSSNFPTTSGAYDTTHNGNGDAYIAKFDATGSNLLYSTFIGGSNNNYGRDIVVDYNGNAYMAGSTRSTDFPTTPNAYDISHNGNRDAVVVKLDKTGSKLLYSTYLGGINDDWCQTIRMDDNNVIYIGGATASPDFPTTLGAYDTFYNSSGNNGFVAKLQILSPQDKIRLIIDKINELVTNGILEKSKAHGLIAKLEGAIDKIDKGHNHPAKHQLNAFINQVNGFINAGKLSPTVGQELIDDANDVINEL